MKTIFIMALLATAHYTYAQTEVEQPIVNAPKTAENALKATFPEARSVNWDKICVSYDYTATFMSGEMETVVTYDTDGKQKSVEKAILLKDIPQATVDYMKKHHPTVDKYKKLSKVTNNTGNVTYEIEGGGEVHVFDHHGVFVRTEKE